jgi:transcription initiation factor TFIIB
MQDIIQMNWLECNRIILVVVMTEEQSSEMCPECENSHVVFDYDRGELVCNKCGLVLEDNCIDHGPEWRAFDDEGKSRRERVGAPMTYTRHDKGLSTEIGWVDKDSYGNNLSRRNRSKFYRLRKLHSRSKTPKTSQQNIKKALIEISKVTSKMGLPKDVTETAAYLYRKAVAENLTRGRTIVCICAASIYTACRQCGNPRTLDEVAKEFDLKRREVGRTYMEMFKLLKLKLPVPTPELYVSRFCGELKLNGPVQTRVKELLEIAKEKGLVSGRSPMAIVGALIYIASRENEQRRTQAEIAEVANVTEVTIRNRYKEIKDLLEAEKSDAPISDEFEIAVQ